MPVRYAFVLTLNNLWRKWFIIAKLFGFIQLRESLNHRRGAVTWVSFDILMQFKFSVWSSNWADKLCISDRLIIWLAGLIRGRVAADYIQHNTVSPRVGGQVQDTSVVSKRRILMSALLPWSPEIMFWLQRHSILKRTLSPTSYHKVYGYRSDWIRA